MAGQNKEFNTASLAFAVLTGLLLITTSVTIYSFVKCTDLESRLSKLEQFIEGKIHESASDMGEDVEQVHLRKRRDASTDQFANIPLHDILSLRGRDGKAGRDGRDGAGGPPGAPGQTGQDGRDGRDGQDGGAGRDGQDGVDGKDCDCNNGIVSSAPAVDSENRPSSNISNQLAHIMGSIAELRNGHQHESLDTTTTTSVIQGGSTYIRWGRFSCGNNSQLIYHGFAAGQHYDQEGGSSEYTCLPLEPEWNSWSSGGGTSIYGAEYESQSLGIFPNEAQDKNVPCSQCYTQGRSAVMMIPARKTCPDSWTKEYEGYLMTGWQDHKHPFNYACVDAHPQYIAGSSGNGDGALFYFVQAECSTTHHCPHYINGRQLTCVVCSK